MTITLSVVGVLLLTVAILGNALQIRGITIGPLSRTKRILLAALGLTTLVVSGTVDRVVAQPPAERPPAVVTSRTPTPPESS
jgi:hypothetical protein